MANNRWLKLDKNDTEMIQLIRSRRVGEIKIISGDFYIRIEKANRMTSKKLSFISSHMFHPSRIGDEEIKHYCAIVKKGSF